MRPAADKYQEEHDPHRGVCGDAAGRVPVGQSGRHLRAARHADRGHARQHRVRSGVRRQRGLRHLPRAQVHQWSRVSEQSEQCMYLIDSLDVNFVSLSMAFAFKQSVTVRK